MELPPNDLKHALREGRPRIGLWSQLTSPIAVEGIDGLFIGPGNLAARFTPRRG
jgi:2-keto-3-deoxy-L-rhamnonate aldolase RhmA